jgi:hypothetical protein
MSATPARVEKFMSLGLGEFHRSLKTLAPGVQFEDGQRDFVIAVESAEIRIVYEPLEIATLGGLLALPRARVSLHLGELDEAQRHAFLARFDRAFQRGGG